MSVSEKDITNLTIISVVTAVASCIMLALALSACSQRRWGIFAASCGGSCMFISALSGERDLTHNTSWVWCESLNLISLSSSRGIISIQNKCK